MKTNFGFAAVGDGNVVLHLSFYEDPPTHHDRRGFIEELATDPEFDMMDLVEGVDFRVVEMTPAQVVRVKEAFGIPDELE